MSADKVKGMDFRPFMVDFDLLSGIMRKPDTQLVRLASSMRGHYADAQALEELIAKGDPIHYEVFEKTVPQTYGHLQVGISKCYPGTVGGECFMTKGHYHKVVETGEIYIGGDAIARGYLGQPALTAERFVPDPFDPRPGARFSQLEARYITPDVIVKKLKGKWTAYINPDAYPRLRVNRLYAEVLAQQRRGNGKLSGQLQEARWLIKNVQQRFETIHRVTQAIVDRQRQFFEHGEVAMRPLVLREIADILGLHESTVSRVTSQKYMATPRGIFELKYFFGSHVATDSGGACSATAIRALIKQLIGAEDGKKPLSDSQLSEILGQQGIVVARRTVAKYRESLNIPPVNLRKTL